MNHADIFLRNSIYNAPKSQYTLNKEALDNAIENYYIFHQSKNGTWIVSIGKCAVTTFINNCEDTFDVTLEVWSGSGFITEEWESAKDISEWHEILCEIMNQAFNRR